MQNNLYFIIRIKNILVKLIINLFHISKFFHCDIRNTNNALTYVKYK